MLAAAPSLLAERGEIRPLFAFSWRKNHHLLGSRERRSMARTSNDKERVNTR